MAGTGDRTSLDVKIALPGRARAERHGARHRRDDAADRDLRAREPAPAHGGLGAAAGAHRRPSRPRLRRGHGRARQRRTAWRSRASRRSSPPPRARTSPRCSTSTTAGCASRCRSTAAPRPPWRRPAAAGSRPGARRGSRRSTSTARTASPSTCSCSAACARSRELIEEPPRPDEHGEAWDGRGTSRFGRYARRLWEGAAGVRGDHGAMSVATGSRAFDLERPAPDRRHRAGGERRDGQDVHDRGARRPLRRGGHAAARPAARDVHADGDGRAARAGPRAPRRRRAGARRRARRRAGARARRGRARCSPPAPREAVEARRARLERALADFDAATIATTHGFCQEVLGGLGVAGDVERGCELVEDVRDLVEEVVDDLYVRRFHRGGAPPFARAEALQIARLAVDNPAAPIEPADAPADSVPAMRRRLAEAIRDELDVRKHRGAVMTYDDLLTRLQRDAGRAARRGRRAPAARALPRRARRRVPGHRPGPVGHHAPRVRRRAAARSC